MLDQIQRVDFTHKDIEVIKDALFTQEKILAVQSRAGGNAAKIRLNELRGLLYRIRGQDAPSKAIPATTFKTIEPSEGIWQQVTRMLSD